MGFVPGILSQTLLSTTRRLPTPYTWKFWLTTPLGSMGTRQEIHVDRVGIPKGKMMLTRAGSHGVCAANVVSPGVVLDEFGQAILIDGGSWPVLLSNVLVHEASARHKRSRAEHGLAHLLHIGFESRRGTLTLVDLDHVLDIVS